MSASVTVTLVVLLVQPESIVWLTLAQLVMLVGAAFTLVVRHRRLEQEREAMQQLTRHLREAQQQADTVSHSKSRFLANISHELRTPLNGMVGMLSMLQASRLDPQQRSQVQTAYRCADHLQVVLNDLMDLSAMEDGKMALQPEPVDLHALLHDLGELMRPQAERKGLTFMVDIDDRLSRQVLGDPTRIKQIVLNLLSNAIKFSDRGRVSLLVQPVAPTPGEMTQPSDLSQSHLHVRVIDQGMGMDSTTLSQLFRRFELGDASTSRRFGGSGLGLAISRNLAQMMGGDITVTSRPRTGSTFTLDLRLPLVQPHPQVDHPIELITREAGSPGLDIVVAEDHPVNRLVVKNLLERMGHGVRFAIDGENAVQETRRKVPDLVLMDLHMPHVDGYEAARQLRSGHDAASQVPIVALTADVLQDSREQVNEAGMEGFLTKPLQLDQVEQLLVRMFGTRGAAQQLPADAQAPTESPAATSQVSGASTALAPSRQAAPTGDIQQHLDMALINEACSAMNLAGYRLLLDQFLLDESRRLYRVCALLHAGEHGELALAAQGMHSRAELLGLTALANVFSQIGSLHVDADAAMHQELCDRLKSAIATTHLLAVSMGLTDAPFPTLPQDDQTTTGSGSSMMPKRS